MFLILLFASVSASQAQQPMTLDQALARARTRAPQILSAQDRIDEARSRLAGASILLQENPTIDGTVGPHELRVKLVRRVHWELQ